MPKQKDDWTRATEYIEILREKVSRYERLTKTEIDSVETFLAQTLNRKPSPVTGKHSRLGRRQRLLVKAARSLISEIEAENSEKHISDEEARYWANISSSWMRPPE